MVDRYARLLVNRRTLAALKGGAEPAELERAWSSDLRAYHRRRARYLIYS